MGGMTKGANRKPSSLNIIFVKNNFTVFGLSCLIFPLSGLSACCRVTLLGVDDVRFAFCYALKLRTESGSKKHVPFPELIYLFVQIASFCIFCATAAVISCFHVPFSSDVP